MYKIKLRILMSAGYFYFQKTLKTLLDKQSIFSIHKNILIIYIIVKLIK